MTDVDFSTGGAVVTGAGSGIGAGLARRAAREGMGVLVADIDLAAAEAVSADLRARGADAVARRIDVRDPVDQEAAAEFAFERWGSVRLLVNNAGVELTGKLWEFSIDQWNRVIDIDLNGVYYGLRAFIPLMLAHGERAHIVNVASVAGLYTRPYTAGYGAAKHGVLALSEIAATELSAESDVVSLSVLLPGAVATAIFDDAQSVGDLGERHRSTLAQRLRNEGISPDQVADIVFDGIRAGKLHIHTDVEMSRVSLNDRWQTLSDSLD